MAIRRRGKKHPKSSGNRVKPSDIRGVSSINPIDVDVNLVDDGNTPKRAGGPMGWIHDGISTLGSGIGNAFKVASNTIPKLPSEPHIKLFRLIFCSSSII